MTSDKFDLLDIFILLAKKKRFIIIFTTIVSICAVIYSLLTPQIWTSQATFYTVGTSASSSLPIDIPGFSSLTSSILGSNNLSQAQTNISIMKSRTFSEKVITHFNLISYLSLDNEDPLRNMDKALQELNRNIVVMGMDEETGLTSINVSTKDKKLSVDIVNFYLTELANYNKNYKVTKGKLNRQFLQDRVVETKSTIDSLSIELKNFQLQNNILDPTIQMTETIKLYSELVSDEMKLDLELAFAKQNAGKDSPILNELTQKQTLIQRQIKNIETNSNSIQPKYMLQIDNIPDASLKYGQLLLNLEIQKKVFEYIYPLYEQSRLEELKDLPSIDIVDYPRSAGIRTKPKRAVICIISFLISLIVASLLVIINSIIASKKDKLAILKSALLARRHEK